MKTFLCTVRLSSVVGHKNPTQPNSNIKENLLVHAIGNWKCKADFRQGWMETFNERIQNLPLLQLLALLFLGLALFSSSLSTTFEILCWQRRSPIASSKLTSYSLASTSFFKVPAKVLRLNHISGS